MAKRSADKSESASAFLLRVKANERVRRLNKLKRGITKADLRDDEIHDIEQIVFLAYGRKKL